VPAIGSTAIAPYNHTTIWDYRKGYVATTDPDLAKMITIGAVCVGVAASVAAIILALHSPPPRLPEIGRGQRM